MPMTADLQEAYHSRCRASEASKAMRMEYCSDLAHRGRSVPIGFSKRRPRHCHRQIVCRVIKSHTVVQGILGRIQPLVGRVTVPSASDRYPSWTKILVEATSQTWGAMVVWAVDCVLAGHQWHPPSMLPMSFLGIAEAIYLNETGEIPLGQSP